MLRILVNATGLPADAGPMRVTDEPYGIWHEEGTET